PSLKLSLNLFSKLVGRFYVLEGFGLPTSDREMLTRRIKDAVDIVGLIGGYLTLKRAGASYKGLCPFHEEKSPSFFVHPAKQLFKCYGCNAGGDVFAFLQLREKIDFIE